MLASRGLGVVLGDLAALGYDARWGVLGAHHAGAPHKRDRIWIVAHTDLQHGIGRAESQQPASVGGETWDKSCRGSDAVSNANGSRFQELRRGKPAETEYAATELGGLWTSEPGVGRMAHGVANRVDRLKALGNGQVSAVVKLAWEIVK
jgi:DNA (cytosine-5)-methyltransferase 1